MTGWKTKVAAIGTIAGGVALLINSVLGDFSLDGVQEGFGAILAGLAIWGLGHKLDKGPVS